MSHRLFVGSLSVDPSADLCRSVFAETGDGRPVVAITLAGASGAGGALVIESSARASSTAAIEGV